MKLKLALASLLVLVAGWTSAAQSVQLTNSPINTAVYSKCSGTCVSTCPKHLLLTIEQAFLDSGKFKFNISPTAGSCLGVKHTEEFKAARRGNKNALGPHSPEHRAKLSAAGRGRKQSPETNAKISAKLTGRKRPPFSDEWRAKLSASLMGNNRALGYKHSAGSTHMTHTPETKAKISAALTGNKNATRDNR